MILYVHWRRLEAHHALFVANTFHAVIYRDFLVN